MNTTTYYMDDVEVAVPAGYVDRTVHTLEWHTEDGGRVALVVQRDPDPSRPSVDQLFAIAMAEYGKRLPMLHVEEPPTVDLAVPHRLAAIRWKKDQDVVYQVQLFVQLQDRNLIATFSARPSYREQIDAWVGEFCRSLMVRSSS
ncbi:DcrB-related protein [Polyangium sp. 15x6]|uniref:DcrB-related protein n=1 Tax=Polyangium sp. 15x6 TaxID=3042687 RepID=UPI00249A5796|nr:DcrB-related protein [Polyangium sp. 15x6]MDI3285333.1 DcrB-related protein [Polyangium sp. 15x6]